MSRCQHCGGDDHPSHQCSDMPPPLPSLGDHVEWPPRGYVGQIVQIIDGSTAGLSSRFKSAPLAELIVVKRTIEAFVIISPDRKLFLHSITTDKFKAARDIDAEFPPGCRIYPEGSGLARVEIRVIEEIR